MDALMPILRRLFPLYRTLVSDGTDKALRIAGEYMPGDYWLEEYPCGQRVWDWTVPQRYRVNEAYIMDSHGEIVADFKDNPLHLAAYSRSINPVDEVEQPDGGLTYSRDDRTIWRYHYYVPRWEFSLTAAQKKRIKAGTYSVPYIDADFLDSPGMHVGVGLVHPKGGESGRGEIVVTSHVDHPYQANDGISGIVSAIALAQMLTDDPLPEGSLSVRFVFCPETIGMIAYLANNEDLIPQIRAGVVLEMTGSDGRLEWNRTKRDDDKLNSIARHVMGDQGHPFGTHPRNDEHILNSPGVDVPSVALHRWPYDEYHTDADTPDICSEGKLFAAAECAARIVRRFASDYVPTWNIRGPAMLSKHGLFVDWAKDWELNRLIERTMQHIDGQRSVWQISDLLNADYWKVRDIVDDFQAHGLVEIV